MKSHHTLGLALGGGGARGLAHIGLLDVLLKNGITPSALSGTSIGAIIAGAFAAGQSPQDLTDLAMKLTKTSEMVKLVDWSAPRRGLLEGKKVKAFLESLFKNLRIEELAFPLAINAVDLCTGQEVVFTQGPLVPAIMASIAVPGSFQPVNLGSRQLVDGGVLNNVPVSLLKPYNPAITIAVDVQINPHIDEHWSGLPKSHDFPVPIPELFLEVYRAEMLMLHAITQKNLEMTSPDILICPKIPAEITPFLGFSRASEIIQCGVQAGEEILPHICARLERINYQEQKSYDRFQ